MNVVKLTADRINEFREYFEKYSHQQDESFPPLDGYRVRDDESAFLLIGEKNEIIGSAVLMLHDEYIEAAEARFRMFHCIEPVPEQYKQLLDAILTNIKTNSIKLKSIYAFIESKYKVTADIWEEIGFEARRFSWILERSVENSVDPAFPEGYEMRTFRDGIDENAWCSIINEAFEHTLGHVRMYPEKIIEWRKEPTYINGGMKLLWHDGKPLATVALLKEENDGEDVIFIEAVGVLNSYQRKGLGRNILRYGVRFAKDFGVKRVMLSVNAENEKAAELYFNEGFTKEALYICYHFNIK
jgi:mycothiol synthase